MPSPGIRAAERVGLGLADKVLRVVTVIGDVTTTTWCFKLRTGSGRIDAYATGVRRRSSRGFPDRAAS